MTTPLRTLVVVGDTTLTKELPADYGFGGTYEFIRLEGGHQFSVCPHPSKAQIITPLDPERLHPQEAMEVQGFPANIQQMKLTSPVGISLELFSLNEENPDLTMGPDHFTGQHLVIKPGSIEIDGKTVVKIVGDVYVSQNGNVYSDFSVDIHNAATAKADQLEGIVVGHTREARLESALRQAIRALNAVPNTGLTTAAKSTYQLIPHLEAALA